MRRSGPAQAVVDGKTKIGFRDRCHCDPRLLRIIGRVKQVE
jgi:hypothetical protein